MQLAHDDLRVAVFEAEIGPNSALIACWGLGVVGPIAFSRGHRRVLGQHD